MTLKDYERDMELCCGCSCCKFIPLEKIKVSEHSYVCPSIARYNFNTYSGIGRLAFAKSLLNQKLECSEKVLEVIYNCQMCGGCDISCKYAMDMDVLEPINETRIHCVEAGNTLPALDKLIASMRQQGTMVPGAQTERGRWAAGLDVKDINREKAAVLFHAGCRASYDKNSWKIAQASVNLLQKGGVDVGIAGDNESCCGGRAYQMGYKQDFLDQARKNMEAFEKQGVKILVTACADCYHAFKVLYDKFDIKGDLEVLHITEYLDQLIKDGHLKPSKQIDLKVTYQDPCHLGRLGESWIRWKGKEIPGPIRLFDPPREFMRGTYGIYDAPRNILRSIPGLRLVEMDRIKEYAWCCGGGGGVKENNPDFARWTAEQRIAEAESTGAEALVTACTGCRSLFAETLKENGKDLKVYDITEILDEAIKEGGQ
jgi:Fe-S oxidoreductase